MSTGIEIETVASHTTTKVEEVVPGNILTIRKGEWVVFGRYTPEPVSEVPGRRLVSLVIGLPHRLLSREAVSIYRDCEGDVYVNCLSDKNDVMVKFVAFTESDSKRLTKLPPGEDIDIVNGPTTLVRLKHIESEGEGLQFRIMTLPD